LPAYLFVSIMRCFSEEVGTVLLDEKTGVGSH